MTLKEIKLGLNAFTHISISENCMSMSRGNIHTGYQIVAPNIN